MLKVIAGRPIVHSLSGGYDSRYVACSFRRYGVEKIACYTYGREGSFEIPYSKRVAEALGYEWHCVDYTNEKSSTSEEYNRYTLQHDCFPYLQNYIAVNELKDNGLIPEGAVMMTGLCNDMPSGFYVPSVKEVEGYPFTLDGVARYLVDYRFPRDFVHRRLNRDPIRKAEHDSFFAEIREYITSLGLEVHDYQSFIRVLDCVTTGFEHARHFLHMNEIHDFFGYEWVLPCWNRELLKFWYSLPVEFKLKQNLYEEYVTHTLGEQFGLTMKKVGSRTEKPRFTVAGKLIGRLKIFLQRLLYPLGIVVVNDLNNHGLRRVQLYKRIKQKEALKSGLTSINLFAAVYAMEQRYGTKWFERIRKALI